VCRAIGDGQTGGGDEFHAVGDGEDIGFAGNQAGSIGAPIDHRHDPVAGRNACHARADAGNDPCRLEPGTKGKGRLFLVGAGDHQAIGEIDPGDVHGHRHLAGAGRR